MQLKLSGIFSFDLPPEQGISDCGKSKMVNGISFPKYLH